MCIYTNAKSGTVWEDYGEEGEKKNDRVTNIEIHCIC
jgi:hypothetical protein